MNIKSSADEESSRARINLLVDVDRELEHCTVDDAFSKDGVIGKIFFIKKYLVTPSVSKLQKWFLHQNGVEFKSEITDVSCFLTSINNNRCHNRFLIV